MNRFVKRLLIFLILPCVFILIDLLSAPNAFTFRQWEALQFSYPYFTYGAFYPNADITMDEVGDLGRHTQYQILKHTNWKTDELGYRNNQYIKAPDILLIGDSFFAGSTLTQDDMISSSLQKNIDSVYGKHKLSVYNLSPADFESFDLLLKTHHLEKPKMIIFSVVERSLNSLRAFTPKENISFGQRIIESFINVIPSAFFVYADRLVKFNLLRYLSAKINPVELVDKFKIQKNGKTSEIQKKPKMLFYNESPDLSRKDTLSSQTITALASYQNYCNKMGIQLIFVPVPDKESVYGARSSSGNQSIFSALNQLDTLKSKNGIRTINVLHLYNQSKIKEPERLLYQYDDTHWNAYGVKMVADDLFRQIQELIPVYQ